jgi:hypothetical protein
MIKSFNRFITEQDGKNQYVPFGFEEKPDSEVSSTSTAEPAQAQTQTGQWTSIKLADELNSQYSSSNQAYKKFIVDLKAFSESHELEGEFSKFTKNPNRFKYTYTERKSSAVKSIEFTVEEFNKYYKVIQEYAKLEDIVDKFESME